MIVIVILMMSTNALMACANAVIQIPAQVRLQSASKAPVWAVQMILIALEIPIFVKSLTALLLLVFANAAKGLVILTLALHPRPSVIFLLPMPFVQSAGLTMIVKEMK